MIRGRNKEGRKSRLGFSPYDSKSRNGVFDSRNGVENDASLDGKQNRLCWKCLFTFHFLFSSKEKLATIYTKFRGRYDTWEMGDLFFCVILNPNIFTVILASLNSSMFVF